MAYDLTDLELFLQVVDQGSITQGAEHTHLSLASASTRITAMEKALGAKLLERHRRGVVPSPTGWLLVAHARAIVGQLAHMRTELARAADGLQSPLVVLANTSATQTLLPTGLAEFLATHPDVDVELQERPSHRLADVQRIWMRVTGPTSRWLTTTARYCLSAVMDHVIDPVMGQDGLDGRSGDGYQMCAELCCRKR
jgi:molybdate transport repressor ModE-like protein